MPQPPPPLNTRASWWTAGSTARSSPSLSSLLASTTPALTVLPPLGGRARRGHVGRHIAGCWPSGPGLIGGVTDVMRYALCVTGVRFVPHQVAFGGMPHVLLFSVFSVSTSFEISDKSRPLSSAAILKTYAPRVVSAPEFPLQ